MGCAIAFLAILGAVAAEPPPIAPDFSNVEWIDTDVGGWSETARLEPVTLSGRAIRLPYDKAGSWPRVAGRPEWAPDAEIVGVAWVFVYRGGRWLAATFDYLRHGSTDKDTTNITDGCGVLRGELSRYRPAAGQLHGFMVSGVPEGRGRTPSVQERSNVVMARWTGTTAPSEDCRGGPPPSAGGGFDLSAPNPAFFERLSRYTAEARRRNIHTIVQVYNMWLDDPGEGWGLNPFNPANNVNPELDYLSGPDAFAFELTRALAGDLSRNAAGRGFLRSVWKALIEGLARSVPPDRVLLQPLVEPFKDEALAGFDRAAILRQSGLWWGRGGLVDNPAGRGDPLVGGAVYRDYHDNADDPALTGPGTIVDTDVRCAPPGGAAIASMARAARARGGGYLVYDCESATAWQPRVIEALAEALGGVQPQATPGQGPLIGYGGPDFWANVEASAFLGELAGAGANLTFVLAIANPSLVAELPWPRSGGSETPGGGGGGAPGGGSTGGHGPADELIRRVAAKYGADANWNALRDRRDDPLLRALAARYGEGTNWNALRPAPGEANGGGHGEGPSKPDELIQKVAARYGTDTNWNALRGEIEGDPLLEALAARYGREANWNALRPSHAARADGAQAPDPGSLSRCAARAPAPEPLYGTGVARLSELQELPGRLERAYERIAEAVALARPAFESRRPACLSRGAHLAYAMNVRLGTLGERCGRQEWTRPGLIYTWPGVAAIAKAIELCGPGAIDGDCERCR
ncbi:MAG: hypothetical protein HY553_13625 [Elusimicrobia bacterium]|nr:hypothetical protein [Elusimicrobiota bacterium]